MGEEVSGNYNRKTGAEKEAASDSAAIRTTLAHEGADKAVQRMQAEVDAVPADQRSAYSASLMRRLQGDTENGTNVLPDLALAFGSAHRADVTVDGVVTRSKIADAAGKESNPVYGALYRQFANKYEQLTHGNLEGSYWNQAVHAAIGDGTIGPWLKQRLGADISVSGEQISSTARGEQQHIEKRNADRRELGLLATKSELFDSIAQNDGAISRSDAERFRDKILLGNDDESKSMRERFGKTPKDMEDLKKTANALIASFDKPANQDNQRGALLVENSNSNPSNWWKLGMGQGDYMTRDSLARGLGYENFEEAQKRLPKEVASIPKPNLDVQSVSDYNNTAQRRNDGPWQVAARMLDGQSKFFKSPDEAQKLLTDVMRQPDVWNKDRTGEPKVTAQNRETVLTSIKNAEAKRAEQRGESENSDLSNWFENRYPALPDGQAPVRGEVTALSDFSNTKLRNAKDGPRAIAGRMIRGQEEFFTQPNKATADLAHAIGVKAGIHNNRKGAEQVTNENIDKIVENIKKTGNQELLDWFVKRYPKK